MHACYDQSTSSGLGDGWYRRELNAGSYTISTATTGSCAFVEMSKLGVDVDGVDLDKVCVWGGGMASGWQLGWR